MGIWLLLALAVAAVGYFFLRSRIEELERKVAILQKAALEDPAVATNTIASRQEDTAEAETLDADVEDTKAPDIVAKIPPQERWGRESQSSAFDETSAKPEEPVQPIGKVATVSKGETIEEAIGTKWMVWLGGVMFALGGIFLVRYAANEGYFNPGVRIFMGALLAVALLTFGEKMRRSPALSDIVNLPNIAIPPIITAVGIIAAFATAYASYALYDMLGPGLAFVLLAVISLASVLLAAVHGPLLAALGLIGSYASPLFVSTAEPSVALLFTYLTFVTVAILALVRLRAWWGLGVAALSATAFWALFALQFAGQTDTPIVLSIYLPLMTALFALTPQLKTADDRAGVDHAHVLSIGSIIVLGAILSLLLFRENYPGFGLISLAAYALIGMVVCYRTKAQEHELILSTALVLLALLAWVPVQPIAFEETDAALRGAMWAPAVPAELEFYTSIIALFACGYAVIGFWVLPRVQNRGLWASISATVPIILLAITYWRSTALETSMAWGFISGVVALVATFAAISSRRQERGSDGAVGAYATAALAALALGLSMVLRDAWLTASLSLLLVGIAWVNSSLALPLLRWVALIIAGVITLRLTFNPSLAGYDISTTPIFNLLIYAYGLPAAAMALTANWMRRQKDDLTVQCLEAGAALLLTLFISFEIHHWMSGGDMFSRKYEFGERAIQTLIWLALSYFYYGLGQRAGRIVLIYAGKILRWLGLAHLLFVQLLIANPLISGAFVGDLFLFNLLALAYLGPVIFTALYYRAAKKRNDRPTTLLFGASTLVLGLAFITVQIRHSFHGGVLTVGSTTDLEWYSYSIVWLLSGLVLFGISFVRGGRDLRIAAMLVITFATAKGFLFDMSALTGILRAVSFIGFGAALIGIGLLYQKFVFPPKRSPIGSEMPEET